MDQEPEQGLPARPLQARRFRLGDFFPSDDPLARWVAGVCMAYNDLILVGDKSVGGTDGNPPNHEWFYFVRLCAAHLFELSTWLDESIRRYPEIKAFVESLPTETQDDLTILRSFRNPEDDPEIVARLARMRNLLFHYPAMLGQDRAGYEELTQALERKADEEVEIVAGPTYRSTRFLIADDLAAVLVVGELSGGASPDEREAAREAAFEPLRKHILEGLTAATSFGVVVVHKFLDSKPQDRIEVYELPG